MQYVSAFSGCSVSDVEAARHFYKDMLGLEVSDSMGGLDITLPGGQHHFIYQKDAHQPATYTVLNLVVENIDEAVDRLVDRGVAFKQYEGLPAPQDDRGVLRGKDAGRGPNIAWFEDPSGNILGLMEE